MNIRTTEQVYIAREGFEITAIPVLPILSLPWSRKNSTSESMLRVWHNEKQSVKTVVHNVNLTSITSYLVQSVHLKLQLFKRQRLNSNKA